MKEDLLWGEHVTLAAAKAQQHLYYLRKLRSVHIPRPLMVHFYTCAISGVLTCGFSVWFAGCTIGGAAGTAVGGQRCRENHWNDCPRDQHHPAPHFFRLQPSGRRFRSKNSQTDQQPVSTGCEVTKLCHRPLSAPHSWTGTTFTKMNSTEPVCIGGSTSVSLLSDYLLTNLLDPALHFIRKLPDR